MKLRDTKKTWDSDLRELEKELRKYDEERNPYVIQNNSITPAYNVKTSIAGVIFMKEYIEERAMELAAYIIENNTTVRQAAKHFGISKSTVHKDITERLSQVNPSLAGEVRKVLDVNKSERHIRGGLATREKYMSQHQN